MSDQPIKKKILREDTEVSSQNTTIEINTKIEDINSTEFGEKTTLDNNLGLENTTQNTYERKKKEDYFIGNKCGENKQYLIAKFIAKGGMGNIYLGVNQSTDIKQDFVVIKFLDQELLKVENPEDIKQRFQREIKLLSKLDHPNIVKILDQGIYDIEDDEQEISIPFFVMEYLQGETLDNYLIKKQKLSLEESLLIITQILAGLRTAHQEGIIHRDLKPENIFLIPTLNNKHIVKILDFGIARKIDSMSMVRLTKMNDYFASPYYISPEHIYGINHLDARSDIYNLGLIFYEIVTGNKPFTDCDELLATKGWLGVHNHQNPIPPNQQIGCEDIPPLLNDIILRCLTKKPNHRFPTAEAMLVEIVDVSSAILSSGAPSSFSTSGQNFFDSLGIKNQIMLWLIISFTMGILMTILTIVFVNTVNNNQNISIEEIKSNIS
ncbi:serine/threonine protein kinase [Cyanobacterium stanieri PCC 7202]|uniref:Serine/threonine protein kinase n=1 Tax=Cyanobacterium stanieri (strain ATCC 29140 / PCC 7202) TaxID=292563 RepID=K9YHZ8_CYASC|nr:serine/threonine protein kinase [Cyanobacterium stanieri PCC 7202]